MKCDHDWEYKGTTWPGTSKARDEFKCRECGATKTAKRVRRECRCCGIPKATVQNRNRISQKYRDAGRPVWMCDGCWEDPALLKSECQHDDEAAARARRIRERLRQVW